MKLHGLTLSGLLLHGDSVTDGWRGRGTAVRAEDTERMREALLK